MLTIFGDSGQFCDGVSRRDFMQIGGLAIGGLTTANFLAVEAQAGNRATGKSLINIFLHGGPSHVDTFDLKPKAPNEFRGEFQQLLHHVPGALPSEGRC